MPRVVDKQQKAEAISRAALGVFRERGYHGSRMADIALAAGVGKGTLYEYFKNKPDILRFAFDQYFESFKAGALQAMSREDGPADRLFALIAFALEHAGEWEDHCVVYVDYIGVERSAQAISLGNIYREMRDMLATLIDLGQGAGTLRGDVDPGATAEALLSIYDGIVIRGVFDDRPCDVPAIRSAALAMVTRGLRPSKRRVDGGS